MALSTAAKTTSQSCATPSWNIQDLSLNTLFEGIKDYCAREIEGVSIDEITEYLRAARVFDHTKALHGDQTLLVFAALGWRSMLYEAAFNVCSMQELAIHQDSNQPQSGPVFDMYKNIGWTFRPPNVRFTESFRPPSTGTILEFSLSCKWDWQHSIRLAALASRRDQRIPTSCLASGPNTMGRYSSASPWPWQEH